VCKNFKLKCFPDTSNITKYLFEINDMLNNLKTLPKDIDSIIPLNYLNSDTTFYDCVKHNNEAHAKTQIEYLRMIVEYMEDSSLLPPANQDIVRENCLKLWDIPKVPNTERTENRSGGRGAGGRGRGRGRGRGLNSNNRDFSSPQESKSKKPQTEEDTIKKFKQLFGEEM